MHIITVSMVVSKLENPAFRTTIIIRVIIIIFILSPTPRHREAAQHLAKAIQF
jgi:hypothetical protein